ncbi:beta-3 adrenergic receptor [Cololabis saira]|uniref:beta-3 adrenergic receptor n=1 Tax=Cololabis saira TaxID=129043 RepID=UPI002AD465E8|nr:beta-3 adrenergic receptor [Cololabis saira]
MTEAGGSRSGSELRLQPAAANDSRPGQDALSAGRMLLEAAVVLMCLGAVTGNILVIVIVAATKSLHSVTSVLIMNLAISDLLVGIGVMPFVALSVMDSGWVQCADLCLYVGFTSSVYCTASVLTLAAIALDRYHSIMDCLRYGSRCTVWRTCAVVLWIWLQALVTSSPPLLGWGSFSYAVPMYICAVDWATSPSYTAVIAAISYLMPAVVILFCYVNIVKVARCHARRIHTLEDSVQRSRETLSGSTPNGAPHQHPGNTNNAWRLIFPMNGKFVSCVGTDSVPPEAATQPSSSEPPVHNSQQHHHGVARLLLLISAFLVCWTPYISMAVVQATEAAISGRSTLVPRSAITFSYWLVLLNSDINPLLYALLSKRFQSALWGLGHKIRTHLGSVLGREGKVRTEGDDTRTSDPCSLTTAHAGPRSSTESLTSDKSKYSSSIFTISAGFKCHAEEHVCHCENSPGSSVWRDAGERRDKLQVPPRPQEGSRLPFSALTKERQATFFFGQITVKVEHDFC